MSRSSSEMPTATDSATKRIKLVNIKEPPAALENLLRLTLSFTPPQSKAKGPTTA